jgi:hypothetical protein
MRVPSDIYSQAIDMCRTAGYVKTADDEFGIVMMVRRCLKVDSPMWRTDNSADWVSNKSSFNLSPAGVGVLTNKQMRTIAPLVGRIFVFDYISKRGIEGARLCLPQDVPAGFDPEYGIRKAA